MKILLIANDPEIIDLIQLTFELAWPELKLLKAETGEKGLRLVELESPQVIVTDMNLPDADGFEILKQIRLLTEMPILVLNTNSEEPELVKALAWGANDYLTVPFRQMEFLARVRALSRNMQMFERDLDVRSGSWAFGRSLMELRHGDSAFELTPVEGFIMQTLMKKTGQYIDKNSLMLKVWGNKKAALGDSLRVHIHHLRKKLGDDNSHPGIITNKPGRGYMFRGDGQFAKMSISGSVCN